MNLSQQQRTSFRRDRTLPAASPLRAAAAIALIALGVLPASASATTSPFRFFASSSFWNKPVASLAPLDPRSAEIVSALGSLVTTEELAKSGPWINTTSYSVPVYTVPAGQPTVSVQLTAPLPDGALSAAWSQVPLPAGARPAAGTDGDLVVWQPSSERLWEFWKLRQESDGWHASWGGAMQAVSSQAGVYGAQAWPGAEPWWGVSASSLSLVGGLITLEDLQRGEINHALSIALPKVRAGVYASPAQRDDGTWITSKSKSARCCCVSTMCPGR